MPMLHKPGQHIDHYFILEPLSSGPGSHVYLAKDTLTGQRVVLKFPFDDPGSSASYKNYVREKKIGSFLTHPNIQPHLNQSEQRQADYLVLEYLEGRTLRSLLQEEGTTSLSTDKVIQIIISVATALVYAHNSGVIHRDMKPENILIMDTGEIKIIDFGIALLRTKQSPLERIFPSPLIGTPNYMAPELFWGKLATPRSDIYAVGIILYELLCGQLPFQRISEFTYMNPQIAHDPPSILSVKPDLSPSLTTVVMRSIRHNPRKRYAHMEDLLHDLSHLDEVVPIPYVPDPPRVGGKYRQIIALGLITLFIFLGMIAFGFLAQFAHSIAH